MMMTRPAWGRVPFDPESRRPWLRMPFDEAEYRARWQRVGDRLAENGLDAVVAYAIPGDGATVRWLTNFESYVGHTAVVVTAAGDCALVTNSLMRAEPMQSSIWMTPVEDVRATGNRRYMPQAKPIDALVLEVLGDYLPARPRVATAGPLPADIGTSLGQELGALPDATVELAELMAVKSEAEIALLRRANQLTDQVLDKVRAHLVPGVSENELAGHAYGEMMRGGGEGPSFPIALVGGPRAGLKHVAPTDYRLAEGDLFFIDFGLIYEGYMTDVARSGVVGRPDAEQRRFLEACIAMTAAAVAVARPGASQSALDDAAFRVAAELGFAEDYYFRAHGVGTALFLPPRFNPGDNRPLRAGELFSLEPMLVRHGYGTACTENTVLITETGAEVVSRAETRWW